MSKELLTKCYIGSAARCGLISQEKSFEVMVKRVTIFPPAFVTLLKVCMNLSANPLEAGW